MLHQNTPRVITDDFVTDPLHQYELMRPHGPMSPVILRSGMPAWLVTDYKLAKKVLSDHRCQRDIHTIARIHHKNNKPFIIPPEDSEVSKDLFEHMLNKDAPDHTRLRKLSLKAFTAQTVARMSERITKISTELLDNFDINTVIDFSEAFGYPLPITMICEILGIPNDSSRDDFKKLSNAIVNRSQNNDYSQILAARDAMHDKFIDIITTKREELRDREAIDLLDELILARDNTDKLSDAELVSMAFLLLVAGHETTVTLLNNAVLCLAKNPEHAEYLRQNPEHTQLFIEEILRVDPPVQFSSLRYVSEPFTLAGVELHAEEIIQVSFLAVNHDPHIYDNPDEIRLGKEKPMHMAFGYGVHFCLGAALARKEATIAIEQFLQRFTDISLAVPEDELVWRSSAITRGRLAVPITVKPRTNK